MPTMTAAQREACLNEIGRVEGWTRVEHEHDPDSLLASAVLCARADYCRDKGLM